jgi:hypothetical protein
MAPISEASLVSSRNPDVTPRCDKAAAIAESRLRTAPYLALRGVACELRDGVLTLRGRVPSYYLKQLAQALLHGIQDVSNVDNQLNVVAPQTMGWPDRDASRAGGSPSRRPR